VDTLKLTAQVVKLLGSRRDDKAQAGDKAEGDEAFGVEIPEIPF
jgi:hypothetical protein